jgi:fibronectin type 3 domain-containing protein
MGAFKPLAVVLFLLSLLTLVSCGQSSLAPQGGDLDTDTTPATTGGFPSIWDLDEVSGRGASALAGGDNMVVLGSEFLLQLHGTVDGTSLQLNPSGENDEVPTAWGLYRFTGLQGMDPTSLNVEATPGSLTQSYYVGLANFTEGTWEWYGPSHIPEFQINLAESNDRYISALGNMYFLVAVENDNTATHHQSTLVFQGAGNDVRPGAPHELHATDGTYQDKIRVEWMAGDGATGYELYRRVDGNVESEWTKIAETQDLGYDDVNVEPGVTYLYKARSVNSAGASDFSNKDSGYAGEQQNNGGCPSNLRASDGTYTEKVRLEWDGDPARAYDVYRRQDGHNEFEFIGMGDGWAYNDTTAEPGVTYIYKIGLETDNGMCFSNQDAGFRATQGGNEEKCPHELFATDGTYEDKVRLEWGGVAGTVYKVFRKADGPNHEFEHIATSDDLAYNDTTAEPGVTYIYKIGFLHDNTWCYSNTDAGFVAGGGDPEGCPTELRASDGTWETGVNLEWNGLAEAGYDVWRKADGTDDWATIAFAMGTSYLDTTAEPGVVYIYKVSLGHNYGGPCNSNTDSGFVAGDDPIDDCPRELSASDGTHENGVWVEWLGGANAWYHVYRRADGTDSWEMIGEANHEFFDETAEAGVIYIYKVGLIHEGQDSCYSNTDAGHMAGDNGGGEE